MRNKPKKLLTLLIFGTILAFSTRIYSHKFNFFSKNDLKCSESNSNGDLVSDNLQISAVSGKIHINNNWSVAKAAGICTGNGTYSDPYVIEDLEIDAEYSGSCILVENSSVYFRIENCTLYNSGYNSAGILLLNANNSQLFNNNCSSNYHYGLHLRDCNYNNITGNTVYGGYYGISLINSNNNVISGNNLNVLWYGISLGGVNNKVSENSMNKCGFIPHYEGYPIVELYRLLSNEIDATNLVNGKLLYYYTNELNLGSPDFTNAGQVILVNCSN
ncbi:MAG: right-handed parallel beta-helix repeat-containing protein, partial [Candidatus Hermodarchaeota archaeon]